MPDSSLQETVREDAMRIISKRVRATNRVRLVVIANVGSAYDTIPGTHHFREHLAFSDTATRSATEIINLMSRYFQDYHAFTGKLNTLFLGEAVYSRFQQLADVLFDIYLNPTFPEEEIKKERGVILNEIAMLKQNDIQVAYDKLFRMLWKHNPIRVKGIGTPRNINKISRNHLVAAHRKWYVPSNTVIICTGRINHNDLVAAANAAFPLNYKKVQYRHWHHEADMPPLRHEATLLREGREQAVILAGVKIAPLGEQTRDQLGLLNAMLGGGSRDSLLWQEIREKRGLTYGVESGFESPHFSLGFCMYFITEIMPQDIEETKKLIHLIACNTPLEKKHFQRQKEALLDSWLISNETAHDWEDTIIQRAVYEGKPISFFQNYTKKRMRQLSRVTFNQICSLREQLLTPERLACVIVRPIDR
ncbi:MAG: pitrilysin family protein [bacterium]|nr:pitrilysin family protein [bacterium]